MHEVLNGEGPIEANLEHSKFGSAAVEMINRLLRDLCAGAHKYKNLFRVGRANIIKQFVLVAGKRGEFVHGVLHDRWRGKIKRIGRLTRLKVNVRVLRRSANERMIGRKC